MKSLLVGTLVQAGGVGKGTWMGQKVLRRFKVEVWPRVLRKAHVDWQTVTIHEFGPAAFSAHIVVAHDPSGVGCNVLKHYNGPLRGIYRDMEISRIEGGAN